MKRALIISLAVIPREMLMENITDEGLKLSDFEPIPT